MQRTGGYKMLNMIFGILPFFAAVLMTQMKENSYPAHLWLSIVNYFPHAWIVYRLPSFDADATRFWKCSRSTNDVQ